MPHEPRAQALEEMRSETGWNKHTLSPLAAARLTRNRPKVRERTRSSPLSDEKQPPIEKELQGLQQLIGGERVRGECSDETQNVASPRGPEAHGGRRSLFLMRQIILDLFDEVCASASL